MKILLVAALVAIAMSQPLHKSDSGPADWESFKVKYERTYESTEEEAKREGIFLNNVKYIKEHNEKYERGEKKYYLAVNKFADMTPEEFRSRMPRIQAPPHSGKRFQRSLQVQDIPYSYDWNTEGAVTAVKDQLNCSSGGWAFSATGALEGQLFIKKDKLESLSEQNLIDCSDDEGNDGCSGGSAQAAFTYVQKKKGLELEADYTFDDGTKSCRYKKSKKRSLDVTGYVQVDSGDETALQEAVYTVGPVSAAINAQETDFIFYSGGVYDDSWCFSTADDLNHYVLVTGWDYDYDDGDYWILKNSWGDDWGYDGYMYLSQFNFNLCGIATNATYPEFGWVIEE